MNVNPTSSTMTSARGFVLSQDDVNRLLSDTSPDSRTHILEKIADGYNDEAYHERERIIAEQIFRLLMNDVALRVRETLADRLKENINLPRDIVLHMTHDVETVAVPVLAKSKVLSDADLVNIVEQSRGQDVGKLIAISKREQVSTRVSEALVETRYAPVMTSLLTNTGATISGRALEKIADDFQDQTEVIDALSSLPELPITVVERIITKVSGIVASELKAKYNLSDRDISNDSSRAREDFMVRLLDHELQRHEVEELVAQMAAEDRLTPSIAITALCRGQLLFFIVALARFSGIPVDNAMRLIADRGEYGFNGIYQKSSLPESMMDAVRILLRAVQDMQENSAIPGSLLYANRLAEHVINTAGTKQIDYLPYFIALIRQNHHRY